MKREELFEVHEPPPHGLTRLKARIAERRAARVLRPVLAGAVLVAAAVVVFFPRGGVQPAVDFTASVAALGTMGADEDVVARDGTAVERLRSTNPGVVLVRVMPTAVTAP